MEIHTLPLGTFPAGVMARLSEHLIGRITEEVDPDFVPHLVEGAKILAGSKVGRTGSLLLRAFDAG